MSKPLLIANDLVKSFPVSGGGNQARFRAVDGVSLSVDRGKTLAVVGRIRLRQKHCRQPASSSSGCRFRPYPAGRGGCIGARPRGSSSLSPSRAGGVSGPFCVARSARAHPRCAGPADAAAWALRPGDCLEACGGTDGRGRPVGNPARALSASVQRRPAAAHCNRAGTFSTTGSDYLRRAGVGTRRFGSGASRQSAAGSAARNRCRLHFHFP